MRGLRERNKQHTRHWIMEAALQLFEDQGFEATTIDEIAAKAEVSPRTVYRYFASKEDLVFLGQEEENQRIAAFMKTTPRADDPVDTLMSATRNILLVPGVAPEQVVRAYRLVQRTPTLRAYRAQLMQQITELVASAVVPARGRRTDVLRARMLAAVYIAAQDVAMTSWIEAGAKGTPAAEIDEVEALLRRAFPQRISARSR